MKRLILIRHSYAENGSFSVSDFERQLTENGVTYAFSQGVKLKHFLSESTTLVSSDAKRAMQTTKQLLLSFKNKFNTRFDNELYQEYTTQDFLNLVGRYGNNSEHLIVVGHNPSIANIAYRLCSEFNQAVSPGTIIVIDFDINNWTNIEVNSGKLIEVIK